MRTMQEDETQEDETYACYDPFFIDRILLYMHPYGFELAYGSTRLKRAPTDLYKPVNR